MVVSAEAVVGVPLLALAYASMAHREPVSKARAAAAVVALALIVAAFTTPLQTYALHTFLWAHLLQNVLLAEWAPALLVLAVPPALGRRAAGSFVFRPLVALPVWLATYFVWHFPWIYDTALEHAHSLLLVEHATYLLTGIAVWWPVVHSRRSSGAKALYLFSAFVLASPIGLMLALVGSRTALRPADRGDDDGVRAGRRLLRPVRPLLLPLRPRGAARAAPVRRVEF